MGKKKLSRREREKMRQRQDMLDAALDLFSEKGYHNVTIQEIAEKAEFAIGTLYKFFSNKEELYKAIVIENFMKSHDTLMQSIASVDDPVEKLRTYVQTKGKLFHDNLPFIRLYVAESRGISFTIKEGIKDGELRERYYSALDNLASIFEAGLKSKQFKKIATPYQLAVALDSTIVSFLLLWLDAPDRYTYPDNPDDILDIFLRGLLNT